jgi:hypothetical protein
MSREKKYPLNHWDLAISELLPEIEPAQNYGGEIRSRVTFPTSCPEEEAVIQLHYQHPRRGATIDKVILFRDGTWRFIPGGF